MFTPTPISVQHYLSTTYRPDCDYIDGEVRERNLGEMDTIRREALVCDTKGFHSREGDELAVPGTPIYVPLKQIFAELD